MKYEIEFIYKDGTREKLIGSGIPTQNEEEYLIKSPDGVEIVRRKENIVGFNIREYVLENSYNGYHSGFDSK